MINDKTIIKMRNENLQRFMRLWRGLIKTLTSKLILVLLAEIALVLVIYWYAKETTVLGVFFDLFWIPGCIAYFLMMCLPLFYFAGAPVESVKYQRHFNEIGLTNRVGIAPPLIEKTKEYLLFKNEGLTPKQWEELYVNIEAVLGIKIVKVEYLKGYNYVKIYYVNVGTIPSYVEWDNKYLSNKDTEIVLGIGAAGPLTVDVEVFPHTLLGGTSGSGKTTLLKNMLYQMLKKRYLVFIADFKGGVDFPGVWKKLCNISLEYESTIDNLKWIWYSVKNSDNLNRKI